MPGLGDFLHTKCNRRLRQNTADLESVYAKSPPIVDEVAAAIKSVTAGKASGPQMVISDRITAERAAVPRLYAYTLIVRLLIVVCVCLG